jgi:hypothetical protein
LRVSRGIGLLVAGSGAWRIGHSIPSIILDKHFSVHFEAGAWIGEYKGHAPLYLWNLTIKLFTLALLVRIAE